MRISSVPGTEDFAGFSQSTKAPKSPKRWACRAELPFAALSKEWPRRSIEWPVAGADEVLPEALGQFGYFGESTIPNCALRLRLVLEDPRIGRS
jgi:hypothetical protein